MTEKEAVEKLKGMKAGVAIIKSLFAKFNETEKFKELILKDGSKLVIDTEEIGVGSLVSVVSEGGNVPAPDGEYELEDGSIIIVSESKISEVKEKAQEEVKVEASADTEMSDRVSKLEASLEELKSIILESQKMSNTSKEEMKSVLKIQSETFKLVEQLAELPASKSINETESINPKVNRIEMLAENLKKLKTLK